ACTGDLDKPQVVKDLRILAIQAEPPEGPVGTDVAIDSLVLDPALAEDPASQIDQAWVACVSAGGTAEAAQQCPATDQIPPPCEVAPGAQLCLVGMGPSVTYKLPALALANRAPNQAGQVVLTTIAATKASGGLSGCLMTFMTEQAVSETCRIGVKRVQ